MGIREVMQDSKSLEQPDDHDNHDNYIQDQFDFTIHRDIGIH